MRSKAADILIIGGGVPGLALAALLAQAGMGVAVAEKYPAPALKKTRPGGRTSALMQGSVNILKAAGAWDDAAPSGEELKILRIIDDSGAKPTQVDFRAEEIGLDAFGVNMPNDILRAALGESAKKNKKIRFIEAALTGYETDEFGVTARFEDDSTVTAKLIAGADGRNSLTRELAGIETWQRDYGQQAITCLINHTEPHDNISTEFHRPSGPFTLVPLPGKMSSVVWVDFEEHARSFMAMDRKAFERALQERSRDALGKIKIATEPQSCPLMALKAKKFTGKRMALIAEAAHVLHPMGAQGLNLSLRDVAALAEVTTDTVRAGLDPGSAAVLDKYERRRKRDVLSRVIGTDGLTRMVSNDFGIMRGLRRIGLKTLDTATPLKEFAMHQGLAPEDGSRLARGERL